MTTSTFERSAPTIPSRWATRGRSAALIALTYFACAAPSARGQWTADYTIQQMGLVGIAQTNRTGLQRSAVVVLAGPALIGGTSVRFSATQPDMGIDTWVWNGVTTTQVGLIDPAHSGITAYQVSSMQFLNAAGQAVGLSARITGFTDHNGSNPWLWNGTATVPIGLAAQAHTGSAGYQDGRIISLTAAGQVLGHSLRFYGVRTDNGQDCWIYDSATGLTTQLGLTGGEYMGNAGYQYSFMLPQSAAGYVAGYSNRYTGVSDGNGRTAWSYNPATGSTSLIGLPGPEYAGTTGFRYSSVLLQNTAGRVAGVSWKITSQFTVTGRHSWIYDPVTNGTVRIGLVGGAYMGSTGFEESECLKLTESGFVAGRSSRLLQSSTYNGSDAWLFDPVTNFAVPIGLTGEGYTGSAGYQDSLTDFLSAGGRAAGHSSRIVGLQSRNGQTSWAYDPVTGVTLRTGLLAAAHTGSSGYAESHNKFQTESGRIAGWSKRYVGTDTDRGENTWAYDPATRITTQTGLTGPEFISASGYQSSISSAQNSAGQIIGTSLRLTATGFPNGASAWVYDPVTRTTVQAGLSGGVFTSSGGFEASSPDRQNAAGQVVGFSWRLQGANQQIGGNAQSLWYFDPVTRITHAVPDSIRASDNYARAEIGLLTDDGFLLGKYIFIPSGGGGEERAFAYRPDRGFTDLGALVAGGLSASGWVQLQKPLLSGNLDTIVGHGFAVGHSGSENLFVMRRPSTPSCCPADFTCSGGLTVQDVFDFLAAWFASPPDPRADFNGTGGVTVQDIFDFLAAWFAGC